MHNADCCVFDKIKPTQEVMQGTNIPKSFEISTLGGDFWVHPNATKHMQEYMTRKDFISGFSQGIRSQHILNSFHEAVEQATKRGVKYNEMLYIGNWELIFSEGRGGDALPVIKHALYK